MTHRTPTLLGKLLPTALLLGFVPLVLLVSYGVYYLFPAPGVPRDAFMSHVLMGPQPQLTMMRPAKSPRELVGDFYYTVGTNLVMRGQLLEAQKFLKRAIELKPDHVPALFQYAQVLVALEQYEEAVPAYRNLIRQAPKVGVLYHQLSQLYERQGKLEESLSVLKEGLVQQPNEPSLLYNIGVLYAQKLDFDNSAKYSKLAIDARPDFAESYNNYGYALAHLGRFQESLDMIDKSLALKPDSAASLDSRGFALLGLKRYDEAKKAFESALELDPTIGEIYLHYGQVLEALKDAKGSLEAYETYLQLEPKAQDRSEVEAKIQGLKAQQNGVLSTPTAPASVTTSVQLPAKENP